MPKVKNIFSLDYNNLDTISIPFSIKNSLEVDTLSTFSGPIGVLDFIPDFQNADSVVKDNDYFFDFGDGTISAEFTASHIFDLPGDYNITLVVSDSAGNFFKSDDQKSVMVKNVVPDSLFLTYKDINTQFRSAPSATMIVTRYNSVVSSQILSSNNYSINLSVSGNESKFFTQKEYYDNVNSQLKNGSFFMSQVNQNFIVIDSIETSSTNLYARLSGGEIVFDNNKKENNFFVGTSGFGTFLYYED